MAKMLLVIPFYNGDRGQVERLGKYMKALSKGKKIAESLLFWAREDTEPLGIGNNFVGLFDEIKAVQMTHGADIPYGSQPWPRACNFQFIQCAQYIDKHRQDVDAFYYCEPDNLPLVPDWFEKLQADYFKQGKPFYGVASTYIKRDGVDAWADGEHMIGTGIYPRNAWQRIKGYQTILNQNPNAPWDAITRDEVNPQCHFTKLIGNIHSSRGFRYDDGILTAIYRPNLEKIFQRQAAPLGDAIILHGCKDSSLRLIMQAENEIVQDEPLTFAHAGDLGDAIYAIPAIEEYCEINNVSAIIKFSEKEAARERMTPDRIDAIAPLLLEQDCIHQIEVHDEGYVDFDFRYFRTIHRQGQNLCMEQSEWVGARKDLHLSPIPWLKLPSAKPNGQIVINRTERYQNELFPWGELFRDYMQQMRFIGLQSEHENFEEEVGRVVYQPTESLLDVAHLIAGSEVFIGNQSVCYAIAEGLKHKRIQETWPGSPDCVFPSDNAFFCVEGIIPENFLPKIATALKSESMDIQELMKHPEFNDKVRQIVKEELEKLLK